MPENQRSCKRIGLFVVVLFGALWQFFDFYTDLKSVVTYKKACSECSGNGTQSTLLGKVSILGVESLLPFSAWLFPRVKNTPILCNLGVNKNLIKLRYS